MHRSASWSRSSNEYYLNAWPKEATERDDSSSAIEGSELPPYDPITEMAMKEKSRAKFAEHAVHFIPLLLLACAFLLWFFSSPEVDLKLKGDSIAAKIEGLTIEGDIDNDSDGTQTGFLPGKELVEAKKHKQLEPRKASRKIVKA